MPTFDLSVHIARPTWVVYALLADIQDFEPIPSDAKIRMLKEPDGPTAVGTRWHEWVTVGPGMRLYVVTVVRELDPPYLLGLEFRSRWFSGELRYDIEPTSRGCRLRHRERLRLHGLPGRLGSLVEHRLRRRLEQRLQEIQALLRGPEPWDSPAVGEDLPGTSRWRGSRHSEV